MAGAFTAAAFLAIVRGRRRAWPAAPVSGAAPPLRGGEHGAHAAGRVARAGDVLAGLRRIEVFLAVVGDHAAVHFVLDRGQAHAGGAPRRAWSAW